MLLTGKHLRTLDDKNRLHIPSEFREEIGADKSGILLFFTPGPRPTTLSIYTRETFEGLVGRIKTPSNSSPDAFDFDTFFALVQRVELDKQGRLVVPFEMFEERGIGKDIVLTGQVDHMDIWRQDEFAEYVKSEFMPQWPNLRRHLRGGGSNGGAKSD